MSRRHWIDVLSGPTAVVFVVVVAALTALLVWSAAGVRIEQSNASMNARNDRQASAYRDFKQLFGSDETLLLSVTHPALLDTAGLTSLDELTASAASLDGVARVESLTTARELVHGELGAEDAPLVERPFDRPGIAGEVERALERNGWLTDLLVSSDRRTAGIAIEIEDRPGDDTYRGRVIDALRELIARHRRDGLELHLTGITVQKHDVARLVDRDRKLILPMSAAVLALALALILRTAAGVLLPLLVTGVSVAWTLGVYALLDFPVNVITSLLPPLIMVISVSTSVHLYQGWRELARRHPDRHDRARELLRMLLTPCFLTTLTTVLGLLSLTVNEIPAVQQFGAFSALGVALSFVLNVTLLPTALVYFPWRQHESRRPLRTFAPLLSRIARLSVTQPVTILTVAGLLSLAAGVGVTLLRNNTDLLSFLKQDSPLVRDTSFINEHLTGANALELVLRRTDGAALTSVPDVERIARLEARLREMETARSVIGLADVIGQIHRAELDLQQPQVPDRADELLLCFDLLEAAEDPQLATRLVTPDFTVAHVNVRVTVPRSTSARALIDEVAEIAARELGDGYDVVITGSYYNVVMESDRLVVSQMRSVVLAMATVLLALAVTFRSGKLLLAATTPNLMPVLWTAGIMGYLGIELSSGTVMIGSVVLGIAVDDTIHYLVRFRREYRRDLTTAIRATTRRAGPALVISSMVLALGFCVGALGSFWPTIHFSLLTGVTIISALICDLLVLPACLILVRPGAGDPTR